MRRRMRIVVLLCSGLAAASSGCAGDGPIVESVKEAVQITPPPFDAKAALAKARSLAQAYLSQPQPSGMDFIRYAAHSPAADRETVRKLLQTYAQDGAFVQQMSEAVFKIWTADYDLALIGLALIGESRTSVGQQALEKFLTIPLPPPAPPEELADGEDTESTWLEDLQSKAVEGLAYLRTPAGDGDVLKIVATHPSFLVRTAAIDAYMWNHGDTPAARATLRGYVRNGEEIYLDRIRKNAGDKRGEFDARLQTYLTQHPEVIAAAPQKLPGAPKSPGKPKARW